MAERSPSSTTILRRSVFTFLQNYQFFTTTAAFLAFPFAASLLLLRSSFLISASAAASSSSFRRLIHARIHSLFLAAGFPPSSILQAKISQTICVSVLAIPSTLSSFLFSKAAVILALEDQERPKNPPFFSFVKIYGPLVHTQICNSLLALCVNATCFSFMFIAFTLADGLGLSYYFPGFTLFLSAIGGLVFSIAIACTFIICNLTLIITGVNKNNGGFIEAVKKASSCVMMVRGRTATVLSLAMIINAALAAVEALFQYRIVMRAYHREDEETIWNFPAGVALEGMLIAYLYALVHVLDTIVGYFYLQICQDGSLPSQLPIQYIFKNCWRRIAIL
ncbi:unnamed protein product [Cuscuta europaea]|uniref:Uncharacterized protein n=1 Tax=Cuscuta europaea TaxID=41803 RepID=A0A9P0ZAT1_CUSEU|nr:unnamed protein product [Cuscuta europaea]